MASQTGVESPAPWEGLSNLRERIRAFVGIAAANGSSMSVEELRTLLPAESPASSIALEHFLANDGILSRDLVTGLGEVAPRDSPTLLGRRDSLRMLAQDRRRRAESFAGGLRKLCPGIELLGVSGSTAYQTPKPQDDIDLFLVTSVGRVWTSLLFAMILAKVERLRDSQSPVLCFNRVVDMPQCVAEFTESRDPFVAREALSLQIVAGQDIYQELLRRSPWMAEPFPILYRTRTEGMPWRNDTGGKRQGRRMGLIEFAALAFLGPYLWMVGLRRNRWLRKRNRAAECFRTVVRRSMCAFESDLYEELRKSYGKAFS
jgi:hypothetical protein